MLKLTVHRNMRLVGMEKPHRKWRSTLLCEPDFLYKVIFAKVNSFLTMWTPLCSNQHLLMSHRFN